MEKQGFIRIGSGKLPKGFWDLPRPKEPKGLVLKAALRGTGGGLVKFWDTSAVVPLSIIEPSTETVKSILTGDPSIVVWWATRTECVSALNQ